MPSEKSDYIWTDEAMAIVRLRWNEGYPGGQVLTFLPPDANGHLPSRSALMGKINRMGLVKKPKPVVTVKSKQTKKRVKAKPVKQLIPVRRVVENTGRKEMCTLMELTEDACRWPFGHDPRTMVFCGRRKAEREAPTNRQGPYHVYCLEHMLKARGR